MRKRILATLLTLAATTSSCGDLGLAFGDVNSIIVAADPLVWAGIEEDLVRQLETTVFTVRPEKTFKVTYQNPHEQQWARLRIFKQELLIGDQDDPWMTEALAKVDVPIDPPQIVQTGDVWARGQTLTLLVLPDGFGPEAVQERIPELADLYQTQYREWVVNRMFVSGTDTALVATLRDQAGFELVVPQVYDAASSDSVWIFRNDNPDPAELIRQVTVTWRSPAPETFTPDEMLAWREELVEQYYSFPQVVEEGNRFTSGGPVDGRPTFNFQGVWSNPPESWPAAGPFKTRAVICEEQDRIYLIDSWLYAPGKEKYEYVIQLEEIVGSFDCGGTR
ncbi:MAG: DUF4837 family protein [Gemmatimonadota bacterium]|nr:DUF4837 family protein [Gemmatimonadota bacterium]